jgi:hypothetical protein
LSLTCLPRTDTLDVVVFLRFEDLTGKIGSLSSPVSDNALAGRFAREDDISTITNNSRYARSRDSMIVQARKL